MVGSPPIEGLNFVQLKPNKVGPLSPSPSPTGEGGKPIYLYSCFLILKGSYKRNPIPISFLDPISLARSPISSRPCF